MEDEEIIDLSDEEIDDSTEIQIQSGDEGILIEPGKNYILYDLDNLPNSMEIFAITLTASINKAFYIENILNYFPLSETEISTIKSKLKMRNIKKKNGKKINKKDIKIKKGSSENSYNFFNQITVVMNIPIDHGSDITKDVNIKLFKNGSIQVSGLKSINQCNIMINKIIELLQGDYCIFINPEDETPCKHDTPGAIFKTIRFIESDTVNILNLKINMINTMYQYISKINRSQLYMRLLELKMENKLDVTTRLKYQPDIHAPVHVKIDLGNKKPVTIFIFESGKILIMAAKKRENIFDAFNYINKLLTENHDYVVKRNLLHIIANDPELSNYIDLEALAQIVDDL
jgi:TATA-box binding protein (TBP) (component of TFIID and TFIIIB)